LADLAERGLLETTLVVWMGEFGRDFSGNNHYAKAWTTGFAGAGIAGGRVVGKTDEKAMTVVDRPVKVGDFVATIYKALDINHEQEVEVDGRPMKITDNGQPVNELFA
jgi:arylsulfatase A-like enzyme